MQTHPNSTAGLIMSLASTLPPGTPLARRARRTADRLTHGATPTAVHAGDVLADLLTAADADLSGYAFDGILDSEFDE